LRGMSRSRRGGTTISVRLAEQHHLSHEGNQASTRHEWVVANNKRKKPQTCLVGSPRVASMGVELVMDQEKNQGAKIHDEKGRETNETSADGAPPRKKKREGKTMCRENERVTGEKIPVVKPGSFEAANNEANGAHEGGRTPATNGGNGMARSGQK